MGLTTINATIDELLKRLRPGMEVFVAGCAGESASLTKALSQQPEYARGVRFTGVHIPGVNRFCYAGLTGTTRQRCFFMSPELQAASQKGLVDFLPITYSTIFPYLESLSFDWVIFQGHSVANGFSFSIAADFTAAALKHAKNIAVINNPRLPMVDVVGVEQKRVNLVIEVDEQPLQYDVGELSSEFGVLGEVIAAEIPNGSTLQFGLGKLQKALMQSLKHHRDLRVHSGMVSDPLMQLAQAGALANLSRSSPPVVTGVALGTHALYDYIAEPVLTRFMPVSHTHASQNLARLPNFVSVNSIIEIDLTGQVNAEMLDGKQISGGGGMADFVLGARLAWGGRSILATPASARVAVKAAAPSGAGKTSQSTKETNHLRVSKIVSQLQAGTPVTIARHEVDRVATEFGVVQLRGKSINERAAALISIADPAFRDQLEREWRQLQK